MNDALRFDLGTHLVRQLADAEQLAEKSGHGLPP